jgi:CheY-like chemotaxis protein
MISSDAAAKAVILVVEDEHLLRFMAVDFILEAGFDVVEAANADEAIRILEARTDIHIVFTDIHMPGSMDGMKLAAFVRDRWPPIELIVTSARYAMELIDLPERAVFLPKPYDYREVVAMLNRLAV